MKKAVLVVLASIFVSAGLVRAEKGVFLSSYSAVTNFRGNLCSGQRAFLKRVCTVDGVASSTAAVYSGIGVFSSNTLTGVIDNSETGKGCVDFEVASPGGLYRDQWGTAGVNVIYECY